MSPLTEPTRIILRNGWQPMDPDAAAYITAVEAADGQALEEKVKIAIDNFVLGCKADGIWSAVKASCILAGARTLTGALVPLTGTAPTNYNFVASDYNRKTGLVGDGSTKYLDSNRNNNADPQNSRHLATFVSTNVAGVDQRFMGSANVGANGYSLLAQRTTDNRLFAGLSRITGFTENPFSNLLSGFYGAVRSSSSMQTFQVLGQAINESIASTAPANAAITVFQANGFYSGSRLAFYSIGESINLQLLDARVTDLINKFAEVIP